MTPAETRRLTPFTLSVLLHGELVVLLVIGPAVDGRPPGRPIYEQEIKPRENHLVWYNLSNRLPEVKPAPGERDHELPRARHEFTQPIVSGHKDTSKAAQLIRLAAPEIKLPKPLPLPNVLAGSAMPARPVRTFTLPPEHMTAPAAAMPEAPRVDVRPEVRDLTMRLPVPKLPALPFTPPPAVHSAALPVLAAPPELAMPSLGKPELPRIPRGFVPPLQRVNGAQSTPVLPAAPAMSIAVPEKAELPRIPRSFVPPLARVRDTKNTPEDLAREAPLPAITAPGQAELVIAGLNPADSKAIPPPPGSHTAEFSAGPRLRPNGTEARTSEALLVVPGLMTEEGAHAARATLVASLAGSTSPRNLMEAVRRGREAPESTAELDTHAVRVTNAPDPRLEGRRVYTVAIQMPNVTSFSGSWLVWFAERHPEAGAPLDMSSPVPIHKVDPKYVQAAAEERIEGTVRLFGVIRSNGQVDSVELLRHLDERLDQTAAEALKKWVFEPARRDGAAVDVDAVFEIPFHLAPRLTR